MPRDDECIGFLIARKLCEHLAKVTFDGYRMIVVLTCLTLIFFAFGWQHEQKIAVVATEVASAYRLCVLLSKCRPNRHFEFILMSLEHRIQE